MFRSSSPYAVIRRFRCRPFVAGAARPRTGPARRSLSLFHLAEVELDRSRAAQDLDRDADLALLVVHLFYHAAEVVERAIGYAHDLTRLEEDLRPRLVDAFLHPIQDRLRLALRDRRGLVAAAADEPEHLRNLFHEVPRLVVHLHLHEHIAREELALALAALPFAHLDHFLGRHEDLAELVLETRATHAVDQRALHLVLVVRICVHDEPLQGHATTALLDR